MIRFILKSIIALFVIIFVSHRALVASFLADNGPDLHDLNRQMAQKYPHFFTGYEAIDPDIIQALRQNNHDQGSCPQTMARQHRALYPLLDVLEKHLFFLRCSQQAYERFRKKILHIKTSQNLTPERLLDLSLKMALEKSVITVEEKNLFRNVNQGSDFFRDYMMSKKQTPQDQGSVLCSLHQNPSVLCVQDQDLEREALDHMTTLLPAKVFYPLYHWDLLGLATLVYYTIDDVFPCAFPHKNVTVHGTSLSPFGFALHDILHGIIDPKLFVMKESCLHLLKEHMDRGQYPEPFIKGFLPHITQNYLLFKKTLREIYARMLQDVLVNDEESFKPLIVGFFLCLHEHFDYERFLFETSDVEKIFKSMTERSLREIVERDQMMSLDKDFITDPLTGDCQQSDEDLFDILLKMLFDLDLKENTASEEEKDLFIQDLRSFGVKRTPDAIIVTMVFKNGDTHKHSFFTLKKKWAYFDDYLTLLHGAGIAFEKPDLEIIEPQNRRALMDNTFKRAKKKLADVIKAFQAFGLKKLHDPHEKGSLAERYHKAYHKNVQRAMKAMEKLQKDQESFLLP